MPTQDSTTRDMQWDGSPREIVRKLQFLIDTNHVTVMLLAERTGVSKKLLQDVLDGASMPTESMVRKFAEFFGVTLEFILGREEGSSAKRGSGAVKSSSAVRTASAKGSGASGKGSGAYAKGHAASAKGGATGAKRSKGSGALNIRAIATRHQALVELLVEKGAISARDYHEMVQKIEQRGR